MSLRRAAPQSYRNSPTDPDVLPNLRELFSKHPEAATFGPEALTGLLYGSHCVTRQPEVFEVEAALTALAVEGEMVP